MLIIAVATNVALASMAQDNAMLSKLEKKQAKKKSPPSPQTTKSTVIVRQSKVVVVIQDRSPSMRNFIGTLDEQLKRRRLGSQYIFFSSNMARTTDMTPELMTGGTTIFPAFEELFRYIREALPHKVDVVFISDGEDNNMVRCRTDFRTHLGRFRQEFPDVNEHRLFTVGVGPNFPCDLVGLASFKLSVVSCR